MQPSVICDSAAVQQNVNREKGKRKVMKNNISYLWAQISTKHVK